MALLLGPWLILFIIVDRLLDLLCSGRCHEIVIAHAVFSTSRESMTMKKIAVLVGAILAVATTSSFALTAQQEKMKTCNAEAKTQSLKGEERKSFMKGCLSKKPADAAAPAAATAGGSQTDKMKTCNAEAKGKKGAERKAFMSQCLSGSPAAAAKPGAAAAPAAPAAKPAAAPAAPADVKPAAPAPAAPAAAPAPAAPAQ
jgi:hypothetical protein